MALALQPAKAKPALFLRKRLKTNKDGPEKRVCFPGWTGALAWEPGSPAGWAACRQFLVW
jgi:hypothetical protein